jgi:hypothetical protein
MHMPCLRTRPVAPAALALVVAFVFSSFAVVGLAANRPGRAADEGWISLFNGKDLEGWTPKIRGYPLGENYADTFRVEDGAIKVGYDKYSKFDEKFGHLFYKAKYSKYRLRIEYRFTGEQCPGGPAWALRNSGVMIHCQDPATIRKDQNFPVSLEVQFLGGNGKDPRPTCNVCSPGTLIVMDGKPVSQHCVNSKSPTFKDGEWVTAEVEVHGDGPVIHLVDGKPVIEYTRVELDPGDPDAAALIKANGGNVVLKEGYISLQSESHPIEFRKVEIQPLD